MGRKKRQKTVFTWNINVNNEIFQKIENLKKARLFQHYVIQSFTNIFENQKDLNINVFQVLESTKGDRENSKKVVFRIEIDKMKYGDIIEFIESLNYNQKKILFMIVLHYITTSKSDHLFSVNTDSNRERGDDKFNLMQIFSK